MDKETIARLFGAVFAAQPPRPAHFVVYFRSNTTQLTEESRKLIPEIIRTIREKNSNDISVAGHCDSTADRQYNDRLSRRRAEAVGRLLTAAGIDPKALEISSHGKDYLLIATGDNVAEPRNRRVEITVR
jgi:outer membrane protein OmpA-like peptidoglycan-associated protein